MHPRPVPSLPQEAVAATTPAMTATAALTVWPASRAGGRRVGRQYAGTPAWGPGTASLWALGIGALSAGGWGSQPSLRSCVAWRWPSVQVPGHCPHTCVQVAGNGAAGTSTEHVDIGQGTGGPLSGGRPPANRKHSGCPTLPRTNRNVQMSAGVTRAVVVWPGLSRHRTSRP